jgi:hypothetical protein
MAEADHAALPDQQIQRQRRDRQQHRPHQQAGQIALPDQPQPEGCYHEQRKDRAGNDQRAVPHHHAAPFAGSRPCGRNTRIPAIRM